MKPYYHQQKIIDRIQQKKSCPILAETGTGKTASVLWSIHSFPSSVIVVPAPLLRVWMDEAEKIGIHLHLIHGPRRKIPSSPGHYLTTYDTFRVDSRSYPPLSALFLDEAQLIKSRTSKRTRAILEYAARVPSVFPLTGTPYGGSYQDVFPMLFACRLMDWPTFRRRHVRYVRRPWGIEELTDQNIPALLRFLADNSLTIRKADCLDLPPSTFQTIPLSLSPEQKSLYKRVLDGGIFDEPIRSPMECILKLRQISSGFVIMPTETHTMPTEKHAYLESLPFDGPTVIWAFFRQEIRDISRILSSRGIPFAVADGENPAADAVRSFQDGSSHVLVANLQSVQYGFTLTRASLVIYYSPTYSSLQRTQSMDRQQRIGLSHSVHYIDLVSSPVEREIIHAVQNKIDVAEHLMQVLDLRNKFSESC